MNYQFRDTVQRNKLFSEIVIGWLMMKHQLVYIMNNQIDIEYNKKFFVIDHQKAHKAENFDIDIDIFIKKKKKNFLT